MTPAALGAGDPTARVKRGERGSLRPLLPPQLRHALRLVWEAALAGHS